MNYLPKQQNWLNGRFARSVFIALLCGLFATITPSGAAAQSTHSAKLTWADTLNPVGTTYTVLRATGLCSGTPSFATLASGVAVMTYIDTTVTPGNYCYEVEASSGGVLSAPSSSVAAPVPSFAPTALSVTVQ